VRPLATSIEHDPALRRLHLEVIIRAAALGGEDLFVHVDVRAVDANGVPLLTHEAADHDPVAVLRLGAERERAERRRGQAPEQDEVTTA
jgi:hypothetical protein